MTEGKNTVQMPHQLILEDRRALTVSGVSDVDSFDEQTIIVFTDMRELTVSGTGLHINKLSIETGELTMEGNIQGLSYNDDQPSTGGGGFFGRLFK